METTVISALGIAGTVLSTVSLMPQVFRTWRTRSAADISSAWLYVAMVSMVVWILYGGFVNAHALIWANALTFIQVAIILVVKFQNRAALRAN